MRKPSARGTITRNSVLDAALSVADRDGFDRVTIRAIATEVGATPMTFYTYFADKDALYDGMRERLFSHVSVVDIPRRTWQSMLEGIARGVHRVMREHPNWTPLLARDSGVPRSGFGFINELWELMLKEGFAVEDTMRAYGCVMSFAVGSVLFERIMVGGGDVIAKRLVLLKEILARAPEQFASLSSVAAQLDNWRWDDVFDLGIRSLLSGIESHCARPKHRSERGRPRPRSRK
jgi:AcrR family transcriptional regulator